jgi:type IV fimbrial biogenesis protein FimT
LNAWSKSRNAGFSLVELMISVALLAILVGVAVPSFQSFLRNSQIRNAAESVLNGLQRARAEAVARNTNVVFTLGANSAWTISVVATGTVIDSRAATEGSADVTRAVLPAGATTATFNSFGGVAAGSLTRVDLTAVGGSQNLRVTINAGGGAMMEKY